LFPVVGPDFQRFLDRESKEEEEEEEEEEFSRYNFFWYARFRAFS
jgi:hypothetical protein